MDIFTVILIVLVIMWSLIGIIASDIPYSEWPLFFECLTNGPVMWIAYIGMAITCGVQNVYNYYLKYIIKIIIKKIRRKK